MNKKIHLKFIFILGICLTLLVANARAEEQSFGLVEKQGQFIPAGIMVLNEDSVKVDLLSLLDKPTLISFVYYHCPSLCPKMMDGIAELVNYSESMPGVDYQIINLSIDHEESLALAGSSKALYSRKISKQIDSAFWRFLIADSSAIRLLTNSIGYEFKRMGDDFVHTTSTVLITPKGMISQYFYGTYFNYMHFDMSLAKASQEEIVPTRLKTLKYCYNYQPEKNRRLNLITKIFGISVIIVVLGLFTILTIGVSSKSQKKI